MELIRIKYILKQYIKTLFQVVVLPFIYNIYKKRPICDDKVLFADSHNMLMPASMKCVYEEMLKEPKYNIYIFIIDFDQMTFFQIFAFMLKFMKEYANAKYVFICDYFLPVSSCNKRYETEVVQLWHASGALKKFGYSTSDDISSHYKTNPFKNYDVFTVSGTECVAPFQEATRAKSGVIKCLGVSKTDLYFDVRFQRQAKDSIIQYYKEALGKKIILWAPTFRGKANAPSLEGEVVVDRVTEKLKKYNYYVIKSVHPHLKDKGYMTTEELLVCADIIITDYSSIIFDAFLLLKKVILFAPDLKEYDKKRGFYLPYSEIPAPIVLTSEDLIDKIRNIDWYNENNVKKFNTKYMNKCDGHATERIMRLLEDRCE